jgi:hypothetical protein
MNAFFRVLTPRCGDEPGTIERWNQKKYTSSHKHVPPHWRAKWNETKSMNPDDYMLDAFDGCQYTPEARDTFLGIARLNDAELTSEQKFFAGEYVGVSAFDNAKAALDYGQGPLASYMLYVVFEGAKLASLKEEGYDGGCRVKFINEVVPPINRDKFINWLRQQTP